MPALDVLPHVHGLVHQLSVVVFIELVFHSSRTDVGNNSRSAHSFQLVVTTRSETVLGHLREQVILTFLVHLDIDGGHANRELILHTAATDRGHRRTDYV